MKKLKIVALAVLLLVAAVLGWHWWSARPDEAAADTVRIFGHIDIRDAQLAFIEQERLAEVKVEEGNTVAAGQVLARLDTRRLQATINQTEAQVAAQQQVLNRLLAGTRPQEIEQARAQVEAAKVRVDNARRSFERTRQTAGAGASSEQALDNARAQLDVETANREVAAKTLQLAVEGPRREDIAQARSQLEAAQASLELLRVRLADTQLQAPEAGVVRSRILEPGEIAGPTRPVLTLALIDPKWVRAYLPEPQLGLIKEGLPARVTSDSFPGRAFEGWVGFISPEAEFTPKNVETTDLRTQLVYEVRIQVRDPDNQLRLGMPVSVQIDRKTATPKAEK